MLLDILKAGPENKGYAVSDEQLRRMMQTRWEDSQPVWNIIENTFKKNTQTWEGLPDWLATVPAKRSKARDNIVFRDIESRINKLTTRPAKPAVSPANKTDEAKVIATNLQDYFLGKYRDLNVKRTLKRALRYLHFARIGMVKVFWNQETDDFDVRVCDPKKVRVSKRATCARESDWAIENIDDKNLLDLLELFPDKQALILQKSGMSTMEEAIEKNPPVEYREMWIGNGVCWVYKGEVLERRAHPFFDFDGLLLTPEEKAEIEQRGQDGEASTNGRRRRVMFQKFKMAQGDRLQEIQKEPEKASQYEVYLYNHHDKPRIPYIFGTVLEVEDRPIGRTSHIEIVQPLQDNVDKRKRQISDNADFINGITKVDTDVTDITLADARKAHNDPDGLLYGHGVSTGVTRETGEPLPTIVFQDLQDSRNSIDALMGTNATFRGDDSGKGETATGRAVLREEGLTLLDEPSAFVDYMAGEIYDYWYQMIRVRYTISHFVKGMGSDRASETIELMQDDLQEGIEIKIIPGSTLPEDKLYKAERAREDAEAGLIDIQTYLEQAGGYDNPELVAKRAIMYKTNPLSVVTLNEDDVKKLEEAAQILAMVTPTAPGKGAVQGTDEQRLVEDQADKEGEIRARVKQLVESEEFKKLPRAEKARVIRQIREKLAGGAVEITNQ